EKYLMKLIALLGILSWNTFSGGDPGFPRDTISKIDSKFGFVGIPNSSGVSHAFNPPIEYKLNSLGFRDDEFRLKKKSILALGASYTFGEGIAAKDRWTDYLESNLCDTEVRNVSVPGYMIDQSYILLKSVIDKGLVSKIVIFQPGHFQKNKLHLGLRSWEPFSRKPMVVFKDGKPHVINADSPIAWSLEEGEVGSFYNSFAAGYNKILFDWFLFPKSEKSSYEKAKNIILSINKLVTKNGGEIIYLVHEEALLKILKELKFGNFISLLDLKGKYQISDKIHHLNSQGNKLIAERVFKHLNEKQEGYLCRN
ncbi:MAG: hypothetical protein NXH75_17365, partial [Halobacteriovoraceae bacterium]|nr:hypothetical protein [Halobacteriovoraceae bacterium]